MGGSSSLAKSEPQREVEAEGEVEAAEVAELDVIEGVVSGEDDEATDAARSEAAAAELDVAAEAEGEG